MSTLCSAPNPEQTDVKIKRAQEPMMVADWSSWRRVGENKGNQGTRRKGDNTWDVLHQGKERRPNWGRIDCNQCFWGG
jgi:hypothetical protein